MRLKYYLRGLGIGIILTVIIMMISLSGRKETLTDEEIIQRARKLGMVMKDEKVTGLSDAVTEKEGSEEPNQEDENSDGNEPEEPEAASEEQGNGEEETGEPAEPELVEISVLKGEYSDKISQKLFAEGLIDDAEAFNSYLVESGYDNKISGGAHYVPKGSTYEEIAIILCEKPED